MGRCQNINIHRNLEEVDSTLHGWLWAIVVEIVSEVKVTQLCLTLWDPNDHTVRGILQARILESVAFPFSRGFSQPRDQTEVSRIAGGFFISWTTKSSNFIVQYFLDYSWHFAYPHTLKNHLKFLTKIMLGVWLGLCWIYRSKNWLLHNIESFN